MELVRDCVCFICKQNSVVLNSEHVKPYLKCIQSAFLNVNHAAYEEFQETLVDQSLCGLCCYKSLLSHKLKELYETTIKQSTTHKRQKICCFFCGTKYLDLILIHYNPNVFDIKIKSFLNCTLLKKPYLHGATCLECLYYLDVWFEVNCALTKLLKSMDNGYLRNTLAITMPEDTVSSSTRRSSHRNKRSLSLNKSLITRKVQRTMKTPTAIKMISNKVKPLHFNGTEETNLIQKANLNPTFKDQFKHLKTVKYIDSVKSWPLKIQRDPKLFSQMPYVFLSGKDCNNRVEVLKKSNMKLRKRSNKCFNKSDENNYLDSQVIEISDNEKANVEESQYCCKYCDKTFFVPLEYKCHMLWHDKPQKAMINVYRVDLPMCSKASVFLQNNSFYELKSASPSIPAKINELVEKYTGKTDLFDEDDHNPKNEIDDIINSLNSPEEVVVDAQDKNDISSLQEKSHNTQNEINNTENETTNTQNEVCNIQKETDIQKEVNDTQMGCFIIEDDQTVDTTCESDTNIAAFETVETEVISTDLEEEIMLVEGLNESPTNEISPSDQPSNFMEATDTIIIDEASESGDKNEEIMETEEPDVSIIKTSISKNDEVIELCEDIENKIIDETLQIIENRTNENKSSEIFEVPVKNIDETPTETADTELLTQTKDDNENENMLENNSEREPPKQIPEECSKKANDDKIKSGSFTNINNLSIEKALAEIHGERDEEPELQLFDREESIKNSEGESDNELISQEIVKEVSKDTEDENNYDKEGPTNQSLNQKITDNKINTINIRKQKRVSKLVIQENSEEYSNENETDTSPQNKRVRFSLDTSICKSADEVPVV